MVALDHTNLPRLRARRVHAYAASFTDELANELISSHTNQNEICLDPFSGAATSLIQARLLNRSAIGIDIDPVACLIARVVTTPYSAKEIDEIYERLTRQLDEIKAALESTFPNERSDIEVDGFSLNGVRIPIPQDDNLAYWFAPIQRALLAAIVHVSNSIDIPKQKDVIDLSISSAIIHKWPYTLSYARDIDHSRPHRVLRDDLSVDSQVQIFYRALGNVFRILRKLNKLTTDCNVDIQVIEGDSVEVLTRLEPASVDYVITSPPYFNAIDYPRAHKFSQWWLWPQRDQLTRQMYVGLKPGEMSRDSADSTSDLVSLNVKSIALPQKLSNPSYFAFRQYAEDLSNVIGRIADVLKPGKRLSFVVANNTIEGVEVPVVEIVSGLLKRNGFQSITIEKRAIMRNRRRYPFGIRGFKGLMESEYIVNAVSRSDNGLGCTYNPSARR
jgi:tRNA G10  N-methylase Trm11